MHKKFDIKPVLSVFWESLRRYKFSIFLTIFLTIGFSILDVIAPLYYKQLLDIIVNKSPSLNIATELASVFSVIVVLNLAGWAIRRGAQFANAYLTPRVMDDLTKKAFSYTVDHSYDFFTNNFTGSIVRKISRLSRAYEQVSDRIVYELLPLVVTLTSIIIVLFSRQVILGTIFSVWVVVFLSFQIFIARYKSTFALEMASKDSEATGFLSDAISNESAVRLFTGEENERGRFGVISDQLKKLRIKNWIFDEWINLVLGLLAVGIELGLIYAGIKLWQAGSISVGDFVLIQAYLGSAISRLWNFGGVIRRVYDALADASEMVEILDLPHGIKDKPRARKLKVTDGVIEFRKVGFNYQETRSVLNNFNLRIEGREKVALVGPSGAGKTTVTKLLFRFMEVTKNAIFIDGQNIANVTQESLRKNIALVPQESVLFHRTLMENIRYGRRDATDDEVIEAAKKANCYNFIIEYPEDFNTHVGERGVKLSGGERQRVAIARAILKNAPILVLDEATSSLDSESESLIKDALSKLMEGKTVIVIAHRLSTIMKMDRIVVLQDGKVLTTGTHAELISEEGGLYKKLWEIQAGGFLPD